jgi:hypothetical protein
MPRYKHLSGGGSGLLSNISKAVQIEAADSQVGKPVRNGKGGSKVGRNETCPHGVKRKRCKSCR